MRLAAFLGPGATLGDKFVCFHRGVFSEFI